MPKVAVIIPSYNHERYIERAIQSVLRQTFSDLELIVVDDGSMDHSLELIHAIQDSRIRIVEQTNQGAHAAINCGLHLASSPYLSILNSDDIYHPRRLEKMLAWHESHKESQFVGSYIEVINSSGDALGIKHGYLDLEPWPLKEREQSFRSGENLHMTLLTENYYATTSNFFFTHECYEHVGDFRGLRYLHDWDFALRSASYTKLGLIPEPLIQYRIHAHNTIRENRAAMIFEICWCLAVHLPQHIPLVSPGTSCSDHFIDQLLHSIYVYGCDRVLAVMLAQNLSAQSEIALDLLQHQSRNRAMYLSYIQKYLDQKPITSLSNRVGANLDKFSRSSLIRKLGSAFKKFNQ
jgi:glycosyltransferase involved in cell wall biosynthesis